jgi:hypothetical protein
VEPYDRFLEVQGPIYWVINGDPITVCRAVLRATVDGQPRIFCEDVLVRGTVAPAQYDQMRDAARERFRQWLDQYLHQGIIPTGRAPDGTVQTAPFTTVTWLEA